MNLILKLTAILLLALVALPAAILKDMLEGACRWCIWYADEVIEEAKAAQ